MRLSEKEKQRILDLYYGAEGYAYPKATVAETLGCARITVIKFLKLFEE